MSGNKVSGFSDKYKYRPKLISDDNKSKWRPSKRKRRHSPSNVSSDENYQECSPPKKMKISTHTM